MPTRPPGLIADIGGTNARFALVAPGGEAASAPLTLPCADYAGPAEAALDYLARVRPERRPRRAAFAVASPVTGDAIAMTNHPWRFAITGTRQALELDGLTVVNDFTAAALAVPHLAPADRTQVGGGEPVPDQPIAVLGAGTGLGVSGLVPTGQGWVALATEGGHVTQAPFTERESALVGLMRTRFDHVSAERLLSGAGLVNLYQAIATLGGHPVEPLTPDLVSERGGSGQDPLCSEAVATFFAMLGTTAANLALTLGARGGVYIAGGIVPRLLEAFLVSGFRQRFEDKGRFRAYLAPIPVYVVTHPYLAFLGLQRMVAGM